MRRVLFTLPVLLVGCGDAGDGYPALVPIDTLVAPAIPAHAASVATSPDETITEVVAAAAATRGRAAAAAAPGASDPALLARAAALRARAGILRNTEPGG